MKYLDCEWCGQVGPDVTFCAQTETYVCDDCCRVDQPCPAGDPCPYEGADLDLGGGFVALKVEAD